MAKVVSEEKVFFPEGHVYILLDAGDEDGYSIDVLGEDGVDGDLVTMLFLNFPTCEMRDHWAKAVIASVKDHEGKAGSLDAIMKAFMAYEQVHASLVKVKEEVK